MSPTPLAARYDGRPSARTPTPSRRRPTLRWPAAHESTPRTGLPADQVRFCRARADKRGHEELGLTHFVDDHPEVHLAIRGVVRHQSLLGVQPVPGPSFTISAPTWPDAEELILSTLA